jgi:RNA polymerase sigma-70 factor (ECF subfamily)
MATCAGGLGNVHLAPIPDFFRSQGILLPTFNAHFLEFIGGLLLIAGLASRLTGFLLADAIFVAYWTGDRESLLSVFSDPGKFYGADPYTLPFRLAAGSDLRWGFFSLDAANRRALEESGVRIAVAKPVERDEAKMIAAILAGDRELYHTLIQPYELSVYRMALSFVKNETEAEDVAQEAILKAFRDLANFRAESKFSTWLISITLNEARRRLRRQSTVRMESLHEPSEEGGRVSPALLQDWREIPSEALERREVRELLQNAIEQLSPIYREVLVLRDIEELSTEETAEVLAISISSVKVRLHRARIMLQKELAPKLRLASAKKRRWLW